MTGAGWREKEGKRERESEREWYIGKRERETVRETERDREDERGFQALETQRYLPRFVVRFVPRRDSAAGADYAMRGHERSESRTLTYERIHVSSV